MRPTLVELARAKDPRREILERVGDLSGHKVLKDLVLVATYIEPEVTKGGIYKTETRLNESRYQGKVGLVLKLGPTAFKYDGPYPYEGPVPREGVDYVQYHPGNGREFFLGGPSGDTGISCRQIPSPLVEAIIDDPEKIW